MGKQTNEQEFLDTTFIATVERGNNQFTKKGRQVIFCWGSLLAEILGRAYRLHCCIIWWFAESEPAEGGAPAPPYFIYFFLKKIIYRLSILFVPTHFF